MTGPRPLSALLVLTDGSATGGRPLVEVIREAIDGGARAVLLREKHLGRPDRLRLAERLAALLEPVEGALVVASDPGIPADGVHLAAADPMPDPRPPVAGRSCHSRDDVARARAEGCTYATLSPIFPTASKPGYGPALGTAALADHPLPVWALGGIDAGNAESCLRSGAAGVAVMGAVMGARDPAATVARLCAALTAGSEP